MNVVYIDIDSGKEVPADWGKPVTKIDGQLSGKEPTINGVNKYRRILIRQKPGYVPPEKGGGRDG